MTPLVRYIQAKTILNRSGIGGVDYCLNPYVGCLHGCRYCYASFMKRFTNHSEPWGSFVDIKENAVQLLEREIRKIERGTVLISSVTDCYQKIEAETRLTRACLEVLKDTHLEVSILTKSPLVLRDIDLLKRFHSVEVGLTITTNNESIRRLFEPGAPPIGLRIKALRTLHNEGIRTYVFIGPVLPMNPDALAEALYEWVDRVLIDRMNYCYKTMAIYHRAGLQRWLEDTVVSQKIEHFRRIFSGRSVEVC